MLSEDDEGYYSGKEAGRIGKYYHVEITLPRGEQIESIPELLKPSSGGYELSKNQAVRYEISEAGYDVIVEGVEVNVSMNYKDTLSTYYYWTFTETHAISGSLDSLKRTCYVTRDIWGKFVLEESVSRQEDVLYITFCF